MDITCTLTGSDVDTQLGAWRGLRKARQRSATVDDGISIWFDPAVEAELRDLAAKEASCCSFLTLEVVKEADGDSVRLDITTEAADARPVIDALGELVGAVDR